VDVTFELYGVTFVWDAEKARRNSVKQEGVTFEQVAEAFFDPFPKVVDASRHDEPRDAVIGMARRHGQLLFVLHIAFEEDAIRVISARQATREERQRYED
jgi:uncharacterized DUF497 family protein